MVIYIGKQDMIRGNKENTLFAIFYFSTTTTYNTQMDRTIQLFSDLTCEQEDAYLVFKMKMEQLRQSYLYRRSLWL